MYVTTTKCYCDKCDKELPKEQEVQFRGKIYGQPEYHLCKECTGKFHLWLSEGKKTAEGMPKVL